MPEGRIVCLKCLKAGDKAEKSSPRQHTTRGDRFADLEPEADLLARLLRAVIKIVSS